jgi:hypothetical protein
MDEQQQREADLRDFNRYWWREDDDKYNSADQESHRSTWLAACARAAQQQWVACSERLPGKDHDVLVWSGDGIFIESYDGEGRWSCGNQDDEFAITHWMKLPEPPEDASQ